MWLISSQFGGAGWGIAGNESQAVERWGKVFKENKENNDIQGVGGGFLKCYLQYKSIGGGGMVCVAVVVFRFPVSSTEIDRN